MVHGFPGIRARLEALAAAVPRGSRVADVGSDHGRLPRLLVASGRTDWCVATEFAAGPTRRLRQGVNGTPEADRIEVRRGDGLEVLCSNDRIDVLVMSGMGGVKMLRILDPRRLDELHIERLVLQPQSAWAWLRANLDELGRSVEEEHLVRDRGRFYTVMCSRAGALPPAPMAGFELSEWREIGPCWFRDRETGAVDYWSERLERASGRLERAQGAGFASARAERELASRALRALIARVGRAAC